MVRGARSPNLVPASSQVTISAAAVETCSSQVKTRWSRVYTTSSTPPPIEPLIATIVDPITTAAASSTNPTATPPASRASSGARPSSVAPHASASHSSTRPRVNQSVCSSRKLQRPSSSRSFQSIADDPGVCLAADTSPSPVTTSPAATRPSAAAASASANDAVPARSITACGRP